MNWVYASLLLFSISYPLTQSFEHRIKFAERWPQMFMAMPIVATIFLAWDAYFTHYGIWGFNHEYVFGFYMLKMPIEEWLFFLLIPFACFFIYEVAIYFFKQPKSIKPYRYFSLSLSLACATVVFVFWGRVYTMVTFGLAAGVLAYLFFKPTRNLFYMFLAWGLSLIPFLLVNGVLTALPVVTYNPNHIINFRVTTIPIEDFFYNLAMLFLNFIIYDFLRQKANKPLIYRQLRKN